MAVFPSPLSPNEKVRRIGLHAAVAALVWTVLLLLSYWFQKAALYQGVQELAVAEARTAFIKDTLYRRWASRQGGVYVTVSDENQPNPNLSHVPERDVVTPSGKTLTLVSPAQMTRQVFDAARHFDGPQGHISSLNPIQSQNKPDAWEAAALKSFENGVPEITEVVMLDGKPHMRMIRPFVAEKSCLYCHGHQGYRPGDIRGGISVSIPLDTHLATREAELRNLGLWHGALWILGILGIGWGNQRIGRDTYTLIQQEQMLHDKNDELVMTEEELRRQLEENLKSQNELMEEKEKLDTIMACMGDGLAIIGTDYSVLYQNRALQEMFGTGDGTHCYEVYQNHSEPCSNCPAASALQDGTTCTRQLPLPMKGRPTWFETTASPFHDATGRVVGSVQIYRNIEERFQHQAEIEALNSSLEQRVRERTAELEQSNRALETANREMESFSYSVSHDLRAPLRHINGYSQALGEEFGKLLDVTGKEYLKRICAASDRMALLIDDLLELSRVTRTELHRKSINLSSICRSIAKSLRESEPERDTTFVIADGAVAQGDPLLMRQVLENILGNAWKYTSKTPGAIIEFGISPSHSTTTYFVKDNGVGFDMAYSGKLFGAFQRLHGAEFEGTGIGLATVQRIIQRHGGTIWAEGSEGHGATFYFTL